MINLENNATWSRILVTIKTNITPWTVTFHLTTNWKQDKEQKKRVRGEGQSWEGRTWRLNNDVIGWNTRAPGCWLRRCEVACFRSSSVSSFRLRRRWGVRGAERDLACTPETREEDCNNVCTCIVHCCALSFNCFFVAKIYSQPIETVKAVSGRFSRDWLLFSANWGRHKSTEHWWRYFSVFHFFLLHEKRQWINGVRFSAIATCTSSFSHTLKWSRYHAIAYIVRDWQNYVFFCQLTSV